MLITIQPGEQPVYRQIADGIRAFIASGELAGGDSLPPMRQLAADIEVNLNTVAAAYRILQEEGLVEIRHGLGATIARSRSRSADLTGLRRKVRAVLAEMMLSGMPRAAILEAVAGELNSLHKGKKR